MGEKQGADAYYSKYSEVKSKEKFLAITHNQKQRGILIEKDSDTIGLHLKTIIHNKNWKKKSTAELFSLVEKEGDRNIKRNLKLYNLDAIISGWLWYQFKKGISISCLSKPSFKRLSSQRLCSQ